MTTEGVLLGGKFQKITECVVALLSVDLVESVDLVSVVLVVNCIALMSPLILTARLIFPHNTY